MSRRPFALLIGLLAAWFLSASPAVAGDSWPSGTRKWDLGKTDPTYKWDGSVTYQKSDGSIQRTDVTAWHREENPQHKKAEPKTTITLYKDQEKWRDDAWQATGEVPWLGKGTVSAAGYDAKAGYQVQYGDGKLALEGEVGGKAYLLRIELESEKWGAGDDELGLHVQLKSDNFAGVEGQLKGTMKAGEDGVNLEGKLSGFLGAKATGQVPVTVSFCYMKGTGKLKGEVSYGIGGTAKGTFEIDWAHGKATISGELAATLGLGAGGSAEVTVDLSTLIEDPSKVLDCLADKLEALGEKAIELGTDLVGVVDQALDEAREALADATDSAVRHLAAGLDAVGDAVTDLGNDFLEGLFSVLGGSPTPRVICP